MRYRNLAYGTALSGASFFASLSLTALAQQASSAAAAGQQAASGLEEIVVTATRRETKLQTTPVSVSALTARQMELVAPHDISDLAAFVPNFSAAKITGFNAASFAMRGVGQATIIVYFESPVGVLVDDFVVPSVQTQLLDTFDLAQVEVLRGPQGTLFGKNTTAGAVAVHTKMPDFDGFRVQGQAGAGSYGTWYVKGAVNVPLNDVLALRLIAAASESDGYYNNGASYGPIQKLTPKNVSSAVAPFLGATGTGDGAVIGGEDVVNARAKLLWQPTDDLKVIVQGEVLRDNSSTVPVVNTSGSSGSFPALGFPGYDGGNPLAHAGVNTGDTILDINASHVNVAGGYLNATWDIDAGTFTEVAGYRSQDSRLPFTNAGAPDITVNGADFTLFDAQREDDHDTAQEELRFASKFDGPLNFVSGVFYQHDAINFCVDSLQGFQDLFGASTPFGPFSSNPRITCSAQEGSSYAAYFEGTYAVTDQLKLIGGVRYTIDHKSWTGRQMEYAQQLDPNNPSLTYQQLGDLLNASVDNYPTNTVNVSKTWYEPTWKIGASYQLTDDIFTYLTYAHGYKAGGFNDQIGNGHQYGNNLGAFAAAAAPTNPEFADSYEIGAKTEFFDHRLRVNATAFLVDYSDLQRQLVVPVVCCGLPAPIQTTLFLNAASAEVKGLEGEVEAVVADGLTFHGVMGFQDAKYGSYKTIGAGYNLATSPLDRTPRWSWTVEGTYTTPVADWGKLTADASVTYAARNLFSQSITGPSLNAFLPARTLLDASLTLTDAEEKYYVKLIGRNLTDKTYLVGKIVVAGLYTDSQYGPPRYVGVEFGGNF